MYQRQGGGIFVDVAIGMCLYGAWEDASPGRGVVWTSWADFIFIPGRRAARSREIAVTGCIVLIILLQLTDISPITGALFL
jgi:hypothetical protein